MARPMRHEKPKDLKGTLLKLSRYLRRHIPLLLLIALLVVICSVPPSTTTSCPAIFPV